MFFLLSFVVFLFQFIFIINTVSSINQASSEEAKATAEGDLAETIKGLKDAKDTLY